MSSQNCIEEFLQVSTRNFIILKKHKKTFDYQKKCYNMKIIFFCKLYNEFTQSAFENIEILDINTI